MRCELCGVPRKQVVYELLDVWPLLLNQVTTAVELVGTQHQVRIRKLPQERSLTVGRAVGADAHERRGLRHAARTRLIVAEVARGLADEPLAIKGHEVGSGKRHHVASVPKTLARTVLPQAMHVVELGAHGSVHHAVVERVARGNGS